MQWLALFILALKVVTYLISFFRQSVWQLFFNMDDHQYLANVITTSWAGIVPNNMVMLPMDSSTSSASIILVEEFHLNGRYYSNQAPASLPLLLKLVSLLSFFCGYFLAISGLFGLHHNGLFTFGLSDWTTRTIGLSQFVLKRLLDYSNWTYGSSGLSKFGLHSK